VPYNLPTTKSVTNESNSWAIFTSPNKELLRHSKPSKKQPSYHLINNHLKSISFWSLQSWSIRHEAGEGRRRRACTHSMATEIEGFKPYRPTSNLAHAVHSPFFRQRARAPIHQNLRACTVHTPPPPWQSPLPPSHKIQIFKNCAHQTLCKKKPTPSKTLTTRFFSNRSHQ
jgi:hypothetical protein